MAKNSERVKMCFEEFWFDQMMGILDMEISSCENFIKKSHDEDEKLRHAARKKEIQFLQNKIFKYGHYEEHPRGKEVRVDFFASEARELIWLLLGYSTRYSNFEHAGYYDQFKEKHDMVKNNDAFLPYLLTSGVAHLLYSNYRCGYEYLVRNEDGKLYYVDHGFTKLIKKDGQWVDEKWGTGDPVFEECNLNLIGVRWEDEKPVEIIEWLKAEGWIQKNGEFIFE